MEETDDWIIDVARGLLETPPISPGWSICKVPRNLRSVNKDAYTPHILSIGPIHHEDKELLPMEDHKRRYLLALFNRTKQPYQMLMGYYRNNTSLDERVRACYAEPIPYGKHKLAKILLHDAGFLLELFFRYYQRNWTILQNDPIFTSRMILKLHRDMVLLENQIPFFVLESLFTYIYLDVAAAELDFTAAERVAAAEREFVGAQRDFAAAQRVAAAQRDFAGAEREFAGAQRDFAAAEREFAAAQRYFAVAERDFAGAQRDFGAAELDFAGADFAGAQRNFVAAERDFAAAEGEFAGAQRDFAAAQREFAAAQPDFAAARDVAAERFPSTLKEFALQFFKSILNISEEAFRAKCRENCNHLLHLLYNCYLPSNSIDSRSEEAREFIHSATSLSQAGVVFRKYKTNDLFDLQFHKGTFKIPSLRIHYSTDSLFRNLVALEQCQYDSKHYITSYIMLMDRLIDTASDVELLQAKRIIVNDLGDGHDVSNLFNDICTHIVLKDFYFAGLCNEVNAYAKSRRHRYWASWHRYCATLRHDYFKNPWSIMSLVAAITLLVLTFLQALYSVLSYYQKPN